MAFPVLSLRVRIFLFFALLMIAIPLALGAALWIAHQASGPNYVKLMTTYVGVAAVMLILLTALVWQLFDQHIASALQQLAREMQTALHTDKLCAPSEQPLRYLGPVGAAATELTSAIHELRSQCAISGSDQHSSQALVMQQMANILRDLDTGVLVMNLQHEVLLYNQRALLILAVTDACAENTLGLARPVKELIRGSALEQAVNQLLGTTDCLHGNIPLILKSASQARLLEAKVRLVFDAEGKPNGYVLVFDDATQSLSGYQQMQKLANDTLEGTAVSKGVLLEFANDNRSTVSEPVEAAINALDEHVNSMKSRYDALAAEFSTQSVEQLNALEEADEECCCSELTVVTEPVLPARPEFYDFDLFNRSVPEDMNQRLLKHTDFVVFDTETTGLNPSGGDEMISIAAVRIVNGRVLRGECFDELIHPGRRVPASSTVFHGITDDMLVDRPNIIEVLPRFERFVGDAVLIAHNAAFDMKFIELKSDSCGTAFSNPVLDTVLLSAWLHDHTHKHTLDDLAERYRVSIDGRHSALGDAVATAEVFLCMLSQLDAREVRTLSEALQVSSKMTHIKRHQKSY